MLLRFFHAMQWNFAFQFAPVGQFHVNQNDPITGHVQMKRAFIFARAQSFCIAESRSHAGMRHISFEFYLGIVNGVRTILHFHMHSYGAYQHGFRRDIAGDGNTVW